MAERFVNQGLGQNIGLLFACSGDTEQVLSMAVDDRSTGFGASDTTLVSPANVHAEDFDSPPTRSGVDVTVICTLETGDYNQTVRRISWHMAAAASVTGTSTTLVVGVDGQSLVKTNDMTLTITATFRAADT